MPNVTVVKYMNNGGNREDLAVYAGDDPAWVEIANVMMLEISDIKKGRTLSKAQTGWIRTILEMIRGEESDQIEDLVMLSSKLLGSVQRETGLWKISVLSDKPLIEVDCISLRHLQELAKDFVDIYQGEDNVSYIVQRVSPHGTRKYRPILCDTFGDVCDAVKPEMRSGMSVYDSIELYTVDDDERTAEGKLVAEYDEQNDEWKDLR